MKRYGYVLILLYLLLTGCQSEDNQFEIGVDLVKVKTEINMVDSFSVKLSTVKFDSIPTSGQSTGLFGYFDDQTTGSLQVNSYMNFDLSSSLSSITEDDIFDSICMRLKYADYNIGDSTQMQKLSIYQLADELTLRTTDDAETYLYNTSSFPHKETSIGQLNFYPHVNNGPLLVRLDDDFGKQLIQLSLDEADEVANTTNFQEFLKGFVIVPDEESGRAVIGYQSDSVLIRLYTHRVGLETDDLTYDFNVATDTHYNQIIPDRSGTPFASLSELTQREELPSTESNNLSVIQGSTGIMVRADFPTLNQLFALEDRILLKAELVLKPAIEAYSTDLPSTLNFYETDKANQLGDQLTYEVNSTTYSVAANLNLDELYHEQTNYTVDITSYLSDQLSGNYYNTDNGLLITVPITDFFSQADHLVLSGEKASDYKPKLNLYFLTYE